MSLTRIGMRLAAIGALRGRTLVGDGVLDSEIGAIELKADGTIGSEVERRFVAVYTQSGLNETPDRQPRDLYGGGVVEMIFEVGITAAMLVRNPDTGDNEMFEGVPATDASFEFYLDLVMRQVVDCLLDPANDWAEIWRGFVERIVKIERLRTDNAQQVKLAGHQLKITCAVADDPVRGAELIEGSPLAQLLSALEVGERDQDRARAALMRQAFGNGENTGWLNQQRRLGLTGPELLALGLGPLATNSDDGTAPEFEAGAIEIEGSQPTEVSQ